VPKVIRGTLDGNGNLSVSLPATDDPDLDVTGWTYTVTEHVADAGRPPFPIEVPYSATSIDLSTVAPAVSLPVAVQTALTRYDIGVTVAAESAAAKKADLADPTGAGLVGVQVGNASRTVADKVGESVSIKDFGGVGDNTTDNAAAFAAAEASSAGRIYLPDGRYYTTSAASTLHKHYFGPGYIRTSAGDNAPGRFSWVTTRPATGTGSGYTKYFTADLSRCDAAYYINNVNRTGTAETYFAPETSLGLDIYDNRAGSSGTDARLAAIAALGATSATLNSAAGFAIGDTIAFNDGSDVLTNTRTLTGVAGNVISWASPLVAPAPYAVGYHVTHGVRTMHSAHHEELQHRGAGDCYLHLYRVEASYVGTAGQDHTFFRSTAGIDGGDMYASSDGVYLTGREVTFDDVGHDICVAADVRTFMRANGTAALQATWHGYVLNSAGAASADVAFPVAGKWKALFDSSRMDSSGNGGCVGNMGVDQYFYWGSTGDPAQIFESWGRNLGAHRFGYSSALSGFDTQVAGTSRSQVLADRNKSLQQHEFTNKIFGAGVAGEYNPTPAAGANVAAVSANTDWSWTRVGDFVDVAGQITVQPTAAASTLTTLYIPLPVALTTTFDAGRRCVGMALSDEGTNINARVFAETSGVRAVMQFKAGDTTSHVYGVRFRYKVM